MKQLTKVLNIIMLSIIIVFPAKSQNNKLANTLLWEISGNGLTKPSYLFGTMHVSNKVAFHLQDSFFIAISNVDYVALELNPENWLKDMMESQTFKEMESFQQSPRFFSSNHYNKLVNVNFLKQNHYKQAMVDNNQIINQLLYRITNNPFINNYEEDTYLDLYIYQTGKKLNKKVAGLENFDQSIQMLIKAMLPDEKEENTLDNANKYLNTGNIQEKMEKAYRKQNISELDSLNKLTNPSKNYYKYLIVERNKIMLQSMDSLMKLGPVFTGVGAAHLPGNEGLIELLKNKGYLVKPVMGRETNAGKKLRDKLDEKNVSKATNTFIFKDSIFQYALPDKIVEVSVGYGPISFIYPDMANGTYYSVSRVPHFVHYLNKNEKYLIQQLDSFLYESTPGKIISKKPITSNNGYPGFELVSKLNNGKMMQFFIYFTPLDVVVIKAGGPQRSYKSNEWGNFFKSVKFLKNNTGYKWTEYQVPGAEFNIEIPVIHSVYTSNKNDNKDLMLFSFDNADSSYYQINAVTLDDYKYLEDDTFEYNYLSEKYASTINASLIDQKLVDTRYGKNLEAHYTLGKLKVKSRFIINKNRYYLLSATGKDDKNWGRFFNSLQINNLPLESYPLIDSSMHFRTLTDKKSDNGKTFMETLRSMVLKSNTYEEGFKDDFVINNKTYTSVSSSGKINVSSHKLNKYSFFENTDSLWNYEKSEFIGSISLKSGNFIALPKLSFKENTPIPKENYTYFTIKDTASKQAILVKKVLVNDHIFTLSTIIDTITGTNKWQEQFLSNFIPWDTCKTLILSKPKYSEYLSDLTSTDSASFASAISTDQAPKLFLKYAFLTDSLIQFIDSDIFNKKTNKDKIRIVQLLDHAKFNNEKQYIKLEKIYLSDYENPELQFALLTALAEQKTPVAFNYIKKWINANAPLSSDKNTVTNFFRLLTDSLELCKPLFPDFIKLAHFPEYKLPVTQMLAELIINKKVDASAWISEKNILFRDAQTELKRYNSENIPKNNQKDDDEIDYRVYDIQKITSSLPWLDKKGPKELACYAVIFASISNTDNTAKQYIDRVINTGHRGLIFSISMAKYKTNQQVNDSIWDWFAADNNSRMHFLDWLEITEDTALYPKKYYNQYDMSVSWLMDAHTTKQKDSLQLIGRYHTSNMFRSGYLYVFKYKVKNKWMMNYVGLQPTDTTQVLSDYLFYRYNGINITKLDDKEVNKKIADIRREIRLRGRQRVSETNSRYSEYEEEEEVMF